VSKFAPHPSESRGGKLTFDERVVLHVDRLGVDKISPLRLCLFGRGLGVEQVSLLGSSGDTST